MFFRHAVRFYVGVSAGGAAIGGTLGTVASLGALPRAYIQGVRASDAKTTPGKMADGIENAGRLWGGLVGTGIYIGATPVTYPLSKFYEYMHEEKPRRYSR